MKNFIQVVLFLIAIHQVYAQQRVPVPNGPVNSIVRNGNTVYYGGSFNEVGFETGPTALIDKNTNLPSVNNSFPEVIGLIKFTISDGAGGWYVAGDFTSIGGYPIKYLSHLDTNFQVDTMFNSQLNGEVKTIVVDNDCLFIGGSFTEIQGIENYYIAKIEKQTGGSFLWNANCDGPVNSMVMFNGNLAVGGNFSSIGGGNRNYFAFIDTYYAQLTGVDFNVNGEVNKLFYDQPTNSLYVGGNFSSPINGVFKITSISGFDQQENYFRNWTNEIGYRKYLSVNQWGDNYKFNVKNIMIVRNDSVGVGVTYGYFNLSEKTLIFDVDVVAQSNWNGYQYDVNVRDSFFYTESSIFKWNQLMEVYDIYYEPNTNKQINTFSNNILYKQNNWKSSLTPFNLERNGVLISQNGVLSHYSFKLNPDYSSNYITTPLLKTTSSLPIEVTHVLNNHLLLQGGFKGIFYTDRSNAFAINTEDGSLLPWSPNPNGAVRVLAVDGNNGRIYLGGDFSSLNGILRNRLAQVDGWSGTATSWNPGSDGPVNALLWKSGVVYVGGAFSKIGGLTKKCIGALNTITGTATSFNYPMDADATNEVTTLAITNDTLFIGGNFKNTTSKHYGVGAVRLNSAIVNYQNALSTDPNATSRVNALVVKNNRLYVGGDFDMKFYSTPTTLVDKHNFAVIDLKTKNTLNYAYNGSGIVTALEATQDNLLYISEVADQVSPTFNSLAVLKSNGTIGWNPRQNGRVNTFCLHNDKVHVGGLFDTINSIFKPNYATLNTFVFTEIYSLLPLKTCLNTDIIVKGKGLSGVKSAKIGNTTINFILVSDSILNIKSTVKAIGTLTLTNSNDALSSSLDSVFVVNPEISGAGSVCVGSTTSLTPPSTMGTWSIVSGLTNITLANGIVSGKIAGTATVGYTFSNIIPGCPNFINKTITVNAKPSVGTLTGSNYVCKGSSVKIIPSVAGGTWKSLKPSIASVDAQGNVTGLLKTAYIVGVYSYTITNSSGCFSSITKGLAVDSTPVKPIISGTSVICSNGTAFFRTTNTAGVLWTAGPYLTSSSAYQGVFTHRVAQNGAVPYDNYSTFIKATSYSVNKVCTNETSRAVQLRTFPSKSITLTSPSNLVVNVNTPVSVVFQNGLSTSNTINRFWISSSSSDMSVVSTSNLSTTVKALKIPTVLPKLYFSATEISTGCSMTAYKQFTVTAVSSMLDANNVDLQSNSSILQIYPNPSNGKFYIQNSESDCSIDLVDITGRVIATKSIITGINSIDFSNVSTGKYMLHIYGNTINELKSIILE